jgi:hypothetical protein
LNWEALGYPEEMRYLVRTRVKPGCEAPLLQAVNDGTLGQGSVAEGEYLRNMAEARIDNGIVQWVEVCYCPTPLAEERPYWERYFEFASIRDAHDRARCRDLNGSEPWSCDRCDCTKKLEQKLAGRGTSFVESLQAAPAVDGAIAAPKARNNRNCSG